MSAMSDMSVTVLSDMSVTSVKFNFNRVTAKFMTQFFKANKENDYDTMASIFSTVVTECPAAWGDPAKPDTYLELPFFPVFRDLISHFATSLSAEAKN